MNGSEKNVTLRIGCPRDGRSYDPERTSTIVGKTDICGACCDEKERAKE